LQTSAIHQQCGVIASELKKKREKDWIRTYIAHTHIIQHILTPKSQRTHPESRSPRHKRLGAERNPIDILPLTKVRLWDLELERARRNVTCAGVIVIRGERVKPIAGIIKYKQTT